MGCMAHTRRPERSTLLVSRRRRSDKLHLLSDELLQEPRHGTDVLDVQRISAHCQFRELCVRPVFCKQCVRLGPSNAGSREDLFGHCAARMLRYTVIRPTLLYHTIGRPCKFARRVAMGHFSHFGPMMSDNNVKMYGDKISSGMSPDSQCVMLVLIYIFLIFCTYS